MDWFGIPKWLDENLPIITKLVREYPRLVRWVVIIGLFYGALWFYTSFQPKWEIYEYLHAVDERRWEDAHASLCPLLGNNWSIEDMKSAYSATRQHISPEITAVDENPWTLKAWVRGDLAFNVDVGYQIVLGPGDLWNPDRHEDALWAELKSPEQFETIKNSKAKKPMDFTLRTVRRFEMRRCGFRWRIYDWDRRISYRLDY